MGKRVPVIGLTGGIGSGKSTVAGVLADLGCIVVNSDELAHAALREPHIKSQLVAWWGEGILDPASQVDRGLVAEIVFADSQERVRLEGLIHPWIEQERGRLFAAAPAGSPGVVIDAPLLVEAGIDRQCDAVLFVDADRQTRLDRLGETRGWGAEELNRREATQIALDVKREGADHVISNDGGLDSLREQVQDVFRRITLRQ